MQNDPVILEVSHALSVLEEQQRRAGGLC